MLFLFQDRRTPILIAMGNKITTVASWSTHKVQQLPVNMWMLS